MHRLVTVQDGERFLAGPQGLEPRQTDPKSAVLPLDEGPMGKRKFIESLLSVSSEIDTEKRKTK